MAALGALPAARKEAKALPIRAEAAARAAATAAKHARHTVAASASAAASHASSLVSESGGGVPSSYGYAPGYGGQELMYGWPHQPAYPYAAAYGGAYLQHGYYDPSLMAAASAASSAVTAAGEGAVEGGPSTSALPSPSEPPSPPPPPPPGDESEPPEDAEAPPPLPCEPCLPPSEGDSALPPPLPGTSPMIEEEEEEEENMEIDVGTSAPLPVARSGVIELPGGPGPARRPEPPERVAAEDTPVSGGVARGEAAASTSSGLKDRKRKAVEKEKPGESVPSVSVKLGSPLGAEPSLPLL